MKRDPALVNILETRNKTVSSSSCVAAATEALLDRLIPEVETDPETSPLVSLDARASGRAAPDVTIALPPHDTNIYNFETLQSIANGLDFQEEN